MLGPWRKACGHYRQGKGHVVRVAVGEGVEVEVKG